MSGFYQHMVLSAFVSMGCHLCFGAVDALPEEVPTTEKETSEPWPDAVIDRAGKNLEQTKRALTTLVRTSVDSYIPFEGSPMSKELAAATEEVRKTHRDVIYRDLHRDLEDEWLILVGKGEICVYNKRPGPGYDRANPIIRHETFPISEETQKKMIDTLEKYKSTNPSTEKLSFRQLCAICAMAHLGSTGSTEYYVEYGVNGEMFGGVITGWDYLKWGELPDLMVRVFDSIICCTDQLWAQDAQEPIKRDDKASEEWINEAMDAFLLRYSETRTGEKKQ